MQRTSAYGEAVSNPRGREKSLEEQLRNVFMGGNDDANGKVNKRRSLKFDKDIRHMLDLLWDAVAKDKRGMVAPDEFSVWVRKMIDLLLSDKKLAEHEIAEIIESDWRRDVMDGIDKEKFFSCWFKLTNRWVEKVDKESYLGFLLKVYRVLADMDPGYVLEWKKGLPIYKRADAAANSLDTPLGSLSIVGEQVNNSALTGQGRYQAGRHSPLKLEGKWTHNSQNSVKDDNTSERGTLATAQETVMPAINRNKMLETQPTLEFVASPVSSQLHKHRPREFDNSAPFRQDLSGNRRSEQNNDRHSPRTTLGYPLVHEHKNNNNSISGGLPPPSLSPLCFGDSRADTAGGIESAPWPVLTLRGQAKWGHSRSHPTSSNNTSGGGGGGGGGDGSGRGRGRGRGAAGGSEAYAHALQSTSAARAQKTMADRAALTVTAGYNYFYDYTGAAFHYEAQFVAAFDASSVSPSRSLLHAHSSPLRLHAVNTPLPRARRRAKESNKSRHASRSAEGRLEQHSLEQHSLEQHSLRKADSFAFVSDLYRRKPGTPSDGTSGSRPNSGTRTAHWPSSAKNTNRAKPKTESDTAFANSPFQQLPQSQSMSQLKLSRQYLLVD